MAATCAEPLSFASNEPRDPFHLLHTDFSRRSVRRMREISGDAARVKRCETVKFRGKIVACAEVCNW